VTPGHDAHPHDDLAVYAVDALEPAERAAVDAHLAGCEACRRELDVHRATLGSMALPEEPPAGVWAGISRQIRPGAAGPLPAALAEGPPAPGPRLVPPAVPDGGGEDELAVVVPLPPPAGDGPDGGEEPAPQHLAPGERPAARWRQGRVLAAAAAVAVVVGLGAVLLDLPGDDSGPVVAELAAEAAADPDSTLVTLSSATGEPAARVVLTDDADFVLFDDLPALDTDRTYQLWRTDQDQPVSLGVLGDGAGGAARVSLPGDVGGFAISREPAGGSPSPTDVVAT
jgi:anti-sigma-K factor RskA